MKVKNLSTGVVHDITPQQWQMIARNGNYQLITEDGSLIQKANAPKKKGADADKPALTLPPEPPKPASATKPKAKKRGRPKAAEKPLETPELDVPAIEVPKTPTDPTEAVDNPETNAANE